MTHRFWFIALLAITSMTAVFASEVDVLTISPSVDPAEAGVEVSFVFSPEIRNEGDELEFDFGDGTTHVETWRPFCTLYGCRHTTHTYAVSGVYTVSAGGTIGGVEVAGSIELTVVDPSAEDDLFIATAARVTGFQGARWRTDVVIHNPGAVTASFELYLLKRDENNAMDPSKASFLLDPGRSMRYPDVIREVFGHSGAAALRIIPTQGEVMAISRTYADSPEGTYGQFVPGLGRTSAIEHGETGRLLGAVHSASLEEGFRTNMGMVNLRPIAIEVEAEFFSDDGSFLGVRSYELPPYGFRQEDLVFSQVTEDAVPGGYVVLQTPTPKGSFLAYLSVVDNLTRDPIFVPVIPQR